MAKNKQIAQNGQKQPKMTQSGKLTHLAKTAFMTSNCQNGPK
jgi:hypothetical protein